MGLQPVLAHSGRPELDAPCDLLTDQFGSRSCRRDDLVNPNELRRVYFDVGGLADFYVQGPRHLTISHPAFGSSTARFMMSSSFLVRIHKTLRMSPAMAAGVTDTLRVAEWIFGLVDAAAPAPGPRGPYKKRATVQL